MSSDQPVRLSVAALIAAGFRAVGRDHRAALLKVATVPVAISLLLTVASCWLWPDQPDTDTPLVGVSFLALLYLFELGPITLFAVAWYRILIPDRTEHPSQSRPIVRHSRMLGLGLFILLSAYLILIFAGAVVTLVVAGVCETWPHEHPEFFVASLVRNVTIAGLVGWPLLVYWTARLSFLFPAAAIDRPYRFIDAWRDTREPGIRLACAFAIVLLAFFALEVLLALLAVMAASAVPWMEDLAIAALGGPIDWLTNLAAIALQYLGLAVVFAIFASAFRRYGPNLQA